MLVPIPNLQSLGFPWLFYLIAVPCCAQVSLALPAGDMVIEGDAGSPQPYPKDFIGFLDFLGILGKDFGAFLRPLIYIYILILRVQKIEIYCARLPLRVPGKHLQRALCNFDKDLPVFKASSL